MTNEIMTTELDGKWVTIYECWLRRKSDGAKKSTVVRHLYHYVNGRKETLAWDEQEQEPFVLVNFSDFPWESQKERT